MSRITLKFETQSAEVMARKRGLSDEGEVQRFVDSEVIRRMKEYTPYLSGTLEGSATRHSVPGSGVVHVNEAYAHRRSITARNNGLRGPRFFERMKADHREDILEKAAKLAKARVKR